MCVCVFQYIPVNSKIFQYSPIYKSDTPTGLYWNILHPMSILEFHWKHQGFSQISTLQEPAGNAEGLMLLF